MLNGRFILAQLRRDLQARPLGALLTLLACFFALSQLTLALYGLQLAQRTAHMPQAEAAMVAYLEGKPTLATIQGLQEHIRSRPEVAGVTFIPRRDGLRRLTQWIGRDNPLLVGLEADLLPDALEIMLAPQHSAAAPGLAAFVRQLPGVADVRLSSGLMAGIMESYDTIRRVGLLVITLAVVCLGLVIFLSIRITVLNRRDQLEVLHLLGAARSTLHLPHVIAAGLYGLLAALGALGCLQALIARLLHQHPALRGLLFMPDAGLMALVCALALGGCVFSALLALGVRDRA